MDISAYVAAPLQLEKICRACLTEKTDMRPLYGACLDEMLNSLASVQAQPADGLPSLLCEHCVLQCTAAHAFKQLCEKSDGVLRALTRPESQEPVMVIHSKIEVDERSELDQYAEMAHVKDEHKCDQCGMAFSKSCNLARHKRRHASEVAVGVAKSYVCAVCKEAFPNEESLKRHAIIHPNTGLHPCDQCDMAFSESCYLIRHKKKHAVKLVKSTVKMHVCTVCSKVFSKARNLRQHTAVHLDSKPYTCDQCDLAFSSSSNLSRHKRALHTDELCDKGGEPHLRSACKKDSSVANYLKYHPDHKWLSCTHCNKQFIDAKKLTIHLRLHTSERPHSCDICQKTFTNPRSLENHLRVHTGEKPHLCPVCGKGFAQSGHVASHMRTHTGAKPYVCPTCGRAFAHADGLKYHRSVHTGERPYKCGTCGMCFPKNHALTLHMRTHTGVKSHICEVCGKGFYCANYLANHMASHGGNKAHVCDVCGKTFGHSKSMNRHMKRHLEEKKE